MVQMNEDKGDVRRSGLKRDEVEISSAKWLVSGLLVIVIDEDMNGD